MKLNKLPFILPIFILITSCSGGGSGGGSGTSTVTLSSIAVTPASTSIAPGTTEQFTATGTYSDHSTKDITTSVTWNSDNTAVATISNISGSNGLAASLASGTATITASLSGVFNTTQLTVNSTAMDNVLPITVNGSLCLPSSIKYLNKPCVSVTICYPGNTTNCQTINDILLDTMSYGLRIFKSFQTDTGTSTLISLPQVASGSGQLTECAQFGLGSDWGPVQMADVILGNEKASNVPIHVIDSTFGTTTDQIQSLCPDADTGFSAAGFNGILGVGLFAQDCGPDCISDNTLGYYSCNGSTCTATTVTLSNQVQNPVSMLSNDYNNGVIVRLPAISTGGVTSADGVLILGIGTKSNNTVAGITAKYSTDSNGDFTTVYNHRSYSTSFMDTGSNGLYFDSTITTCTSGTASGWYCPSTTQNLSATTAGYTVSFKIGNASTLFSSSNNVFIELGATYSPNDNEYSSFDWGLPFFLGRSVYVLIDGNTVSGLGTGPYLAY
ncbi:MAG: DUF3443 family protein [Bacteroidia bacterium]|nr:DUF3443 family protein [Bacteroidia bacterium]